MGLKVTHLERRIGALVETDLETLLGGAHAGEIRALLEQRGVLVFRGAEMDDAQQLAFTRTFGDVYGDKSGEIYKVSFDKQASPEHWHYSYGNMSWHIDRTETDLPPFASILRAVKLVPEGGETLFANTYAAYDDLFDTDKRLIEDLMVVHRVESSFREVFPEPTKEQLATWRSHGDKVHPLVWHHRSGRKSLITSMSGTFVIGMDEPEGEALLSRQLDWASQPQYVYLHEWQDGDIVMWDNTGVMHKVLPYDPDAGRLLHRTTVAGAEPFDPRRAAPVAA